MDKDSPNYDPTSSAVLAPQNEDVWVFAGWLKCDAGNCDTRLALFSPRSIPIDDKARKAFLATWTWGDDLKCQSGRVIPKPSILSI